MTMMARMKTTKAERLLAEETALEISRGHMHSCTRQCADTRKVVHSVEEEGDCDGGDDSFQNFHRRTEKDRGWIIIFSMCALYVCFFRVFPGKNSNYVVCKKVSVKTRGWIMASNPPDRVIQSL